MGKVKGKRKLLKIVSSLGLSLLMAMGMMSTNIVSVNALTMTEVLVGKKVTFYVNESINVFDALQAADTRLSHLDTGCFTNLTLNYSSDGRNYYSINNKYVTGIQSGTTTILISGNANCGAYSIYETFNNTPITIEIKKREGTRPSGYTVNNSTKNGEFGSITGLNPSIVYEYKNEDISGSSYVKIPTGSTNISLPKGHYYLRVAETATTNASKAESIVIKEPAQTPSTPTVMKKTDTAITIKTIAGEVYSIDNGNSWINGPILQNLTADTTYTILAKKLGVADEYTTDSEVSRLTVKTKASTNSVLQASSPEVLSYSDTSIKIKAKSDEEYSIDGGRTWNKNGEFNNLNSNQSYSVIARKAENEDAMAGPISKETTIKTKLASEDVLAPTNKPILNATDNTIEVMNPDSKNEYSIDGGQTWIKSIKSKVEFTGLEEGKEYTVLARTAETDTAMPSTATKATKITTLCSLTGNVVSKNYPVAIKILDSKTGKVIQEIETDNQGNYNTLLPKGDYKIVANSNGESMIADIQLKPNDSDKNITLQTGALINGIVKDDKGNPIANAKVIIETSKGNIEITTDEQGSYYVDGIEDGSYQSYIYTTSGEPQSTVTKIEVKQGQMTTASHTELKSGLITKGDVIANLNGNLNPIKNGKVELIDENGDIVVSTTTDKNGSYILPSVAKGTYTLKVTDSLTGAIIERTIKIGNDNATALGTTPEKIDGTTEINAEKFIQNNLVDSYKNIITKATGENYKIILDSQENWDKLTQVEKDETNKILVNKYHGVTYSELLNHAVFIQQQVKNFIDDNMTLNNQIVTEVNEDTYDTIIAAKEAWDMLSNDEKQAANDELMASGSKKTYEELLGDAQTLLKETTDSFISDHMTNEKGIITNVSEFTLDNILGGEADFNTLKDVQKAEVNAKLKAAGATQTYEEMVETAHKLAKDSASQFIKDNLTNKDGKVITSANKDTIDAILSAEDKYNKLTQSEKDEINAQLSTAAGKTITYEEMLALAKTQITQSVTEFIKRYVSDQDGRIYKHATKDNYAQILSGKDVWNKLSQSEKDAINAMLNKVGSKNYEELLKQANVLKDSVKTSDNSDVMPLGILMLSSLVLSGYIILKRRKRI
ncbi:MSCRAMM family protein [Candidatus Stoquefichus massiliensis]|uniref:MSCRAMM family protein n=1 Tax=Candidatus Stoquefichus massiliensis TaxID=1470350 RepID=UPI000480811A|nr:carboxypeptidase-like regulatory domain-containing protein [Candidatus Stoquefichus massiliensis]